MRIKAALLTLILFTGVMTNTPEAEAQETLFEDYIVYSSFVGPNLQMSLINGEPSAHLGAQFGVMADQLLIVAIDGDWLATGHRFEGEDDDYDLGLVQGGVMVRLNLVPDRLVSYSLNLSSGFGTATASPTEGSDETSGYFFLNPNAEVNLSMTRTFRISLGLGYRLLSGTSLPAIDDSDLSGPSASLTFKFGGYFSN